MNGAKETSRRSVKVGGTAPYCTKTIRQCTRGGGPKFGQTERVLACSALERMARKENKKKRKQKNSKTKHLEKRGGVSGGYHSSRKYR